MSSMRLCQACDYVKHAILSSMRLCQACDCDEMVIINVEIVAVHIFIGHGIGTQGLPTLRADSIKRIKDLGTKRRRAWTHAVA